MITHLKATGFKSLNGFSLDFSPGLNILVGPNGSGKTNIVSLFEYLAYLVETDASEATSKAGGAGAVFRRVGTNYEKQIEIEIYGCCPLREDGQSRSNKIAEPKLFVTYRYYFVLCFTDTRDSVIFKAQQLDIRRTRAFSEDASRQVHPSEWGLSVVAELDNTGTPKTKILRFDEKFVKRFFYVPDSDSKPADVVPKIENFINRTLIENVSLVSAISRFGPDFWTISGDISGGQIYNVVPSKIKLPEDSAKPPGIARDGSGLASTLYALQRSKNPQDGDEWFHLGPRRRAREFPANALDQLKGYLRLVNESISGVFVENDPFDNQLRVRFEMKSGDYQASVPLGLMSDGTLKWLALVTAALTNRSVFSVEEPENYLHPEMQSQIVNILREILFHQKTYKFTLMTTHSETLLNRCHPSELIIVSFSGGSTKARRCSNTDEIKEEIQRTGFGLGYYYLTHALQDQ